MAVAAASAKPKASPFRINCVPSQNPPLSSLFKMTFVMESMLTYHSATASALLTPMLAVAPRTYGWLLQGVEEDYYMKLTEQRPC